MNHTSGTVLNCSECGAPSPPNAVGWRALLGYDPREDEQSEAFMFCRECAEREFADGLVVAAFQEPGEASKRRRQKDTA